MNSFMPDLHALSVQRLQGMRRGIEKESLRALADSAMALTPHPRALGSALTHPHITTDFSESQLELITSVHTGVQDCLHELTQIHRFTSSVLGEEMLWVSSMPCGLPPDEEIPIAQYGSSHVARAKSIYRTGLGYRYGRRMQTISGIHYNWSMPDVSSEAYFSLIRNFRRHAYLLLYLFGASPAVCSSFVQGRPHRLQHLSEQTLFLPHATSLRMGRLGYQSDAQAALSVSYNSLFEYANSLQDALTRPYPPYEAIAVRGPDGQYRQLSSSLLQIENEFYGTIRPKRVTRAGERPLHALRERGVEYVEVRLMDLDPFETVGISSQTMRFLDIFLLHCLVTHSPADTPEEISAIARNQNRVAERGREPGLELEREGSAVLLQQWAHELLQAFIPIAQRLDEDYATHEYAAAVRAAHNALEHPESLASARVLHEVAHHFGGSFTAFTQERSSQAKKALLQTALSPQELSYFRNLSEVSLQEQQQLEGRDTQAFEDYLVKYLSPLRLSF